MTDLGTLSVCCSLSFTRRSRHPADRVWAAITDPAEISQWMDHPARVDLRPGGEWHVDFGRTDEGELAGVIVRVVPDRELAYVWGRSVVEWRIEPADGGCEYRFVHHGIQPGDGTEGLLAGWHGFLDDLDAHLGGRPVDREGSRRQWRDLQPPYRLLLDRVVSGVSLGK